MAASGVDGGVEIDQGGLARGTRLAGNAVKPEKKGCVKNLMLTCGVIFLLFAGFFCIGGAAVTAQDFDGDALVGFTCLGIFSLASGLLLIRAYRRLGKESEPEERIAVPTPVVSAEQLKLLQDVEKLKVLRIQSAILEVCKDLVVLRMKIYGFSQQYPMRSLKVGDGVVKAEKQIPWIVRTLKEATESLTTGKDRFGNSIAITETKNGLVQLISLVCDPEYLTFMEMIYEGIADPLESSMQELEQIIERIPTGDGSGPEKRTEEPIPIASEEGEELFRDGLDLFKQEKYREAIPIMEEVTRIDPTFAPAQFMLGVAYSKVAEEYGDDEDAVRPWAIKSAEAFRKTIDLAGRYGGLKDDQLALAQNAVMTIDRAETDYQIQREAASLPEDQRKRIYAEFRETQNSEFLQGTDIKAIEDASKKGDLGQIVQDMERDGVEAAKIAMAKISTKFQITEEQLRAIAQEGEEKKWPWGDM